MAHISSYHPLGFSREPYHLELLYSSTPPPLPRYLTSRIPVSARVSLLAAPFPLSRPPSPQLPLQSPTAIGDCSVVLSGFSLLKLESFVLVLIDYVQNVVCGFQPLLPLD